MSLKDRYFRVSGFKFCETLNNASFDSLAYIEKWGETVAERKPTMSEFTTFLDNEAKRVMMVLMAKNRFLSIKEIGRFACYCVAEGSNSLASISPTRLLDVVDPLKYFKGVIPAYAPKPSKLPAPRRNYKLAFLLMVHGDKTMLENIKFLIDELDDGSSIILIHVDLHSIELFEAVAEYITDRIFNMSLISLGFNVPLRKGREIQRILGQAKFADKNFISHWGQYYHMAQRITRPHLPRMDRMHTEFNVFHPEESGLMFPPYPRWAVCKHHQWLILTREAVEHMRESSQVATVLGFSEHAWIPDEVLLNSPTFSKKIINDNKHYLTFPPNNYHPKFLDMENTIDIGTGDEEVDRDNPRFLFARKVDVRHEGGRELAKWISQQHLLKHLKKDHEYGILGGEDFVVPAHFDPSDFVER
ncbi:hypothetical protein BC829DRAFT_444049 [Chytridium lagenaria]|nr:hypothetical protein BC829DRAFT_444049 [Chytridium lagenaria]